MGRGGRGGFRRGEGAFRAERKGRPHVEWLYGRRPVAEALRAGKREFIELRVSASARDDSAEEELSEIEALAREAGIRPLDDTRSGITSLLGDVNHQGVALKCSPYRYTPFDELLDAAGDDPGATSQPRVDSLRRLPTPRFSSVPPRSSPQRAQTPVPPRDGA